MHCLVKLLRVRLSLKIARLRHLAVRLIIETEFLWAVCSGDHNALEDVNRRLSGNTRFDLSLATEYFRADYYVSGNTWIIAKISLEEKTKSFYLHIPIAGCTLFVIYISFSLV